MGRADIERLLQQSDIVKLVGERVSISRRPGRRSYTGRCPFHKEKTPSFHVNVEREFFHCFGCGEHGDALKFICLIHKVDTAKGIELLRAHVDSVRYQGKRSTGAEAFSCERCGVSYLASRDDGCTISVVHRWKGSKRTRYHVADLCEECWDELERWVRLVPWKKAINVAPTAEAVIEALRRQPEKTNGTAASEDGSNSGV